MAAPKRAAAIKFDYKGNCNGNNEVVLFDYSKKQFKRFRKRYVRRSIFNL